MRGRRVKRFTFIKAGERWQKEIDERKGLFRGRQRVMGHIREDNRGDTAKNGASVIEEEGRDSEKEVIGLLSVYPIILQLRERSSFNLRANSSPLSTGIVNKAQFVKKCGGIWPEKIM